MLSVLWLRGEELGDKESLQNIEVDEDSLEPSGEVGGSGGDNSAKD